MSDVQEADAGAAEVVKKAPDRAADGKYTAKAGDGKDVVADGAAAAADAGKAADKGGKKVGTIAMGGGDVAPATPSDWPTDWRDRMAKDVGGDDPKAVEKELKRLQRFASPNAVWASQRELEGKLTGVVKVPGPKANEEERAAFYKAIGALEKAEDYAKAVRLKDNRVLGDADMPMFNLVVERLHPLGATPAQVSAMTDAYLDYRQEMADQREEADANYLLNSEKSLRKELGNGEYTRLKSAVGTLLTDAPPEVRDVFDQGRDAQGNRLGSSPAVLKWMYETFQALVPNAPHYDAEGGKLAGDRLAELRKIARETPDKFTKELETEQLALIERQVQAGKPRGSRAA